MIATLEREFAEVIDAAKRHGKFPRDVIEIWGRGKFAPKQAWRTLEKWSNKGWYDYGVCLDLGWLTEEGKLALIGEPVFYG